VGLWLVLILMAGTAFRFAGWNWDDGHYLNPDERFLAMAGSNTHWPNPASSYFDESRSSLNPRNTGNQFFVYGSLPMNLAKAASDLTGRPLLCTGRELSAWLDLATVALVFLLARALRLGGRAALTAAALYACSVCAIQYAHFFVVDSALSCFVTAALWLLAEYHASGRARHAAWAGVALGLALACKATAGALVAVALLVCVARAAGSRGGRGKRAAVALCHLALFSALALAVCHLADPTLFASPSLWNPMPAQRWLANLRELAQQASGAVDYPPSLQWAGRTRWIFPWTNMVVWGMGAPLGLAAWAGFAAAAWRILKGKSRRLAIPVAWVALIFLYQGAQMAATMRYFLPVYGCLCVLAAWALTRLRRKAPWAAPAVLALTAVWAAAFFTIYLRPHTRVEASQWIYQHVDRGRGISYEYWDDALPLPLPGHAAAKYHIVEMHWFDEDTPEKLHRAVDWLNQTDYVVLSSNRVLGVIPRLPARYPMTTLYYRALLDGSLGFEPAARFQTWLGEWGEEAFSVYDHPVVRIFRKTARYSPARAEALLGAVRWQDQARTSAPLAGRAPTGLMLPNPGRQYSNATWDALFPPSGLGARWPLALWLAAVFALGWAAFPYLFVACPGMADRGYGFAKTLGWLLAAWLAWLGASVGAAPFERPWIFTAAALMACGGAAIAWARRRAMREFLARRWPLLLTVDALFLGAFLLMAVARMGHPDLWHAYFGGEKPMDFAYLNAVARSHWFPPPNPWFSGGFINYYYFGFVPVAASLKALRIPPEIGYNLALPTLFAMAACGVYSLTHALLGRRAAPRARAALALLGPLFVMVLGNLKQVALALEHMGKTAAPPWTWYFDATRAIHTAPGDAAPITEFPFFTFLYGDLHAHAMALPALILALGMAVSLARARRGRLAALALGAFACGALWAANTWDVPLAATALSVGLAMGCARAGRATLEWLAALAAAWLAFLPFHHWNAAPFGAINWWRGARTSTLDYLIVWGLPVCAAFVGRTPWSARGPLAPLLARAMSFIRGAKAGQGTGRGPGGPPHLAAAALVLAAMIALHLPAWPLAAALALATAFRWLASPDREESLICALAAGGFALTFMVEFIALEGDAGRMNTVFKFGFEAWLLLGVAAAAFVGSRRGIRPVSAVALSLLALAALAYPLTAPFARARDRFVPGLPPTWNGMAFMAASRHTQCGQNFPLAEDLAAIRWLRANAPGGAVIAEANTSPVEYGWGGRFSVYAGLPTIAGWEGHLRQQLGPWDAGRLARRLADLREIYGGSDPGKTWAILQSYDARFVVTGRLEQACYPAEGFGKFNKGMGRYWETVFQSGDTRILKVLPLSH
jgi:YYY domain-containing protein